MTRRKPITQAQISRRARREDAGRAGLTGRARELGSSYPPAKAAR